MNTKKLYLPPNLPEIPPEIKDAAEYIHHRCYVGRALWQTQTTANDPQHEDENRRLIPFTHLYSPILQSMFRNYKEALAWLKDAKIIDIDHHYIVGSESRGYRWTQGYRQVKRSPASPKLSTKITKRSRKTFAEFSQAHKHLAKWLRRFCFDGPSAVKFIEATKPNSKYLTDAEYRTTLKMTIDLIQTGEWEAKVCNYGRFHSPYTCLLSECRQFVTYQGQQLVNIDISNSQPLFLTLLFPTQTTTTKLAFHPQGVERPENPPSSEMLANTLRFQPTADNAQHLHNSEAESEPTTQTQQSKEQERRNAPYMLVKQGSESDRSTEGSRINGQIQNVQKQPQQLPHELPHEQDEKEALPDDMRRYIRDCEQGRFYDSLMEQMNVPPEDRNQFKRDVFREIYFGTSWEDTPLRRAYIARYPHVWELIRKQKKGNYRALAWEMQRAESRLMIDTVVHRFYLEYPHIPIITVHDSILTTPQHVETVKRIMVEEFARLGLHPTIKTTSYARKELDVLQAA